MTPIVSAVPVVASPAEGNARVLILTSEFPPGPGGIGTHAHQMAAGLGKRGWDVVVLASQDYAADAAVRTFNQSQPFPVVRFRKIPGPPLEALYREIVLNRNLRSHAPAALVASGSRAVMLAAARWTGRRVPWIAIGHGTEFGARNGWQRMAVRGAYGRATAVVCVSEFTRKQMHLAGVHPKTERVIPNGADPERFRVLPDTDSAGLKADLALPGARLLVTVGNVTARKGQDIVVRAMPAILERIPGAHYLIAGLPTGGEEIRKLAAELGVADRVHLLGRVEDPRLVRILNAADIFVMTSRHTRDGDFEGYGIAVIEAALCGLPAVVASGAGLAEAVSDGHTGLCVPPEDPGSTARAIVSLLEDQALRRRMGEAARSRAEREQTWPRQIAEYDSLLRELAAFRGRRTSAPGRGAARA